MDNKENYIGLQKAQEMFSKKAENAWYDGTEAYDAFVFSLYAEPIWWDDKINLIKGYRKRYKRPEGKGWCFDFVNQRWFRIRKLTPVECFRLMDVNEEGIDKLMASGISNSQLYKCAGNSIVVSCLYHIFKNLFCPEQINDESVQVGEQLSLF